MKQNVPDVSIIVPVYNCEKSIRKCVESILNQTLKDIEIILVDDGSTDMSGNIIDEMSYVNETIIAVHEENKGVSAARNYGIKIAKGEFVGFVDADDCVDDQMYENLFEKAKSDGNLMSMCRFKSISMNGIEREEKWTNIISSADKAHDIALKMIGTISEDEFNNINTIMGSTCRCIYSRNIINYNNIHFNEKITYAEDLLFNITYLNKIQNISLVDKALYYYINSDSSLSLKYREDLNYMIDSLMFQIEEIMNKDVLEKRYNFAWFKYLIELLRNTTNDLKFFDFKRYIQFNKVVCCKSNSEKLKNINIKKLNMKNKMFYMILKYNMVSLGLIFYIIRELKMIKKHINKYGGENGSK